MPGPTGLIQFQQQFPNRFFDVGIAEQHAVTAAAGMAMGGMRPIVALYSTFLNRAWDQVVYDVALHRLPVIFCLDRAGITGDDGPSHHGIYDMALLSKVPGMRVLAPSSTQEVEQMLKDAITLANEGPVVIRYPKGVARTVDAADIGSGLAARKLLTDESNTVCILAIGKMVGASLDAAALLAANTTVSFTLTNTVIEAGDILILNHISGGTAGSYLLNAQSAAGSASINVRNITAGSLSEAIVIAFAVIKAVTA
jgi:1-deoxy-D-xylulose-5-phosphate synthase